jgi:hypothetical protein
MAQFIPFAGLGYTLLMHFFSYDDKIRSDPNFSDDYLTKPHTWKASDFIPELFTDIQKSKKSKNYNKNEKFVDNLILQDLEENGEIEKFTNDGKMTPARWAYVGVLLLLIIIVRKLHGNHE